MSLKIRRTERFARWLAELRDRRALAKITLRIDRLALGNPGDMTPVGEGVSEMRIDHGPGYRVYYAQRGNVAIMLLTGGDKTTQNRTSKPQRRSSANGEGVGHDAA